MTTWVLYLIIVEMVKAEVDEIILFLTAFFGLCISGPVDLGIVIAALEAFK